MEKSSYIPFTPYKSKDTKSVLLTKISTNSSVYAGSKALYTGAFDTSTTYPTYGNTNEFGNSYDKVFKIGNYVHAFISNSGMPQYGAYIRFKKDLSEPPTHYVQKPVYRGYGDTFIAGDNSTRIVEISTAKTASSGTTVGDSVCYTTTDGINWTNTGTISNGVDWDSLVYYNGYYYLFTHITKISASSYTYGYKLMRSSNGSSWSDITSNLPSDMRSATVAGQSCYNSLEVHNNKLILRYYTSSNTNYYYSTNGTSWTKGSGNIPRDNEYIKHPTKSQFWRFDNYSSSNPSYQYSTDFENWTTYTMTLPPYYTNSNGGKYNLSYMESGPKKAFHFMAEGDDLYIACCGYSSNCYLCKYNPTNPELSCQEWLQHIFSNRYFTSNITDDEMYYIYWNSPNYTIRYYPNAKNNLSNMLDAYFAVPTPTEYEKITTIMGGQEVT